MTVESALTKLAFVVGREGLSVDDRKMVSEALRYSTEPVFKN